MRERVNDGIRMRCDDVRKPVVTAPRHRPALLMLLAVSSLAAEAAGAPTGTSSTATSSTVAEAPPSFVPPTLLFQPEVPYPAAAKAAGAEGPVKLTITIDEVGTVTGTQLVAAPHPALAQAALAAVSQFRFSPALEDGVPLSVTVDFVYRFELPTAEAAAPAAEPTPAPTQLHDEPRQPDDEPDSSAFTIVIMGKRPPRSATDFRLSLGVTHAAPPAGQSASSLMRRAPGLHIAQHGGIGKGHQIFLRGFDAVHGQDLAVSVGGIPINEVSNVHGQGYVDLHYVIPELVSEMRVLPGAYDPRQGDFAVAGSMDMSLGLNRRGLIGRFSVGRFGLLRGFAAWGPESEPDGTFLATEIVKSDGFGTNRAWGRLSAMGQVVLPIMSGVQMRLMAGSYAGRFDSAGVIRKDDFDAGRIGFFDTYDNRQGGSSQRHQGLVEVSYEGEDEDAAFNFFVMRRDFRLRQNFTGFIVDPEGDGLEQSYGATTFGGGGHYRRRVFDWLMGEIGVRFRHDRARRQQDRLRTADGAAHTRDLDDDVGITDLGVYVDGEVGLPAGLILRGGVRFEGLSFVIDETLAEGIARREAFGTHIAPRATLEWRPSDDLNLFASYGNGFRSPQAVTLGQGERSPLTVVQSGELGGRYDFGRLEATLAAFTTYVEADLILDHSTGQNVFAGPTLRTGGALIVEAMPLDWLHVLGSLTYTYATKPDIDEQVPYVPAWVGRIDVDGHQHVGPWFGIPAGVFGAVGLSFVGPRPLPFGESSQPILLLEAALGVELGPVAVSVEGSNLLNLEYRDGEFVYASDFDNRDATSMIPTRHFTAGAPLTVQGTVTLDF